MHLDLNLQSKYILWQILQYNKINIGESHTLQLDHTIKNVDRSNNSFNFSIFLLHEFPSLSQSHSVSSPFFDFFIFFTFFSVTTSSISSVLKTSSFLDFLVFFVSPFNSSETTSSTFLFSFLAFFNLEETSPWPSVFSGSSVGKFLSFLTFITLTAASSVTVDTLPVLLSSSLWAKVEAMEWPTGKNVAEGSS